LDRGLDPAESRRTSIRFSDRPALASSSMTLRRTVREWSDRYWFELVLVGVVMLLVLVVIALVVTLRS
jgi:hypothetical protein